MKTTYLKALLATALLGVLSTGFAQNTTFVLPKAGGHNFTFEASPTFMRADNDLGNINFYGAMVGLGYRINALHKVQLETGLFYANEEESDYGLHADEDYYVYPILLSYTYNILLDEKGQWELNLSPMAGLYIMSVDANLSGYGDHISFKDTDYSFAVGVGVGITYHISPKIYVGATYRFLHAGSTEFDVYGTSIDIGSTNNHTLSLKFGIKF